MIAQTVRTAMLAALATLQTTSAMACACCADAGARYEVSDILSDRHFTALERLHSNGIAHAYQTACGEDCVIGLTPADDWDATTLAITRDGVTLTLANENAGTPAATLTAPAPQRFDWLASDPIPSQWRASPGGLYSETILPLVLRGTGPSWTAGPDPLRARLILIGQSTACMAMETNTDWMLDVNTPEASFRLFGGFAPTD